MATYRVIASDGRVVGRVDSREKAEAIVEMHKRSTKDGKPARADLANAAAASRLSYKVEVES